MKSQYQSNETLRIRLTPFVNGSTGSYITTGTDGCTLTIEKPDGTLYTGATVTATWDSVAKLWYYDIPAGNFMAGEWRVYAVSGDVNALPKWALYFWGDYVDDITTAKTEATSAKTAAQSADTKLGTPAGASVSADVAAVKTDTAAIKTKTDNLPASPANEVTVASAVTEATAAKTAAQAAETAAQAVQADVAIVKKVQIGRWKIQGTQLLLYELDGTTLYKAFDLKDETGAASGTRVFERVPLP